jgi:hypothetical protein
VVAGYPVFLRVVPSEMQQMPDNASPSPNPVILTSLITAALAVAVLTGASLSGVVGGAAQDQLRNAGSGRTGQVLAEERRQTQVLERIEIAVSRVRADIALLNARMDEVRNLDHGVVNAAPINPASGQSASHPRRSGQEFDFGALRASLDADTATPGTRTSRPHPRRIAKGGCDV